MDESLRNRIAPLAALDGDLPRKIFLYIRRRKQPVSREQVAAEVGISRRLAAFHLERLLDHGLLTASYARPPGRSGPGAGRSAKFYAPSQLEVEVSIPGRRYDLAGRLLVEAISSQRADESAAEATRRVARTKGYEIGDAQRRDRGLRPPGAERTLSVASEILEGLGFEPYSDDPQAVALHNCPFHELAQSAQELVCNMNQSFIDGVLRGLGNNTVQSVLECKPGDCCVTIRAGKARSTTQARSIRK